MNFTVKNSNKYTLKGIGVEWDNVVNSIKDLSKEQRLTVKDFEFLCNKAIDSGVQKIRFFLHNGLLIKNDVNKISFSEEKIKDDFMLLDFCEKNNIDVCLVFYDTVTKSDNGKVLIGEKLDLELFLKTVEESIKYLFIKKAYTCIKEISVLNEPDIDIDKYRYGYDDYKNAGIKTGEILNKYNLREKVKLNLSDDLCFVGYRNFIDLLGNESDIFNNHNYICNDKDSNEMIYLINKTGVAGAEKYNKPYEVGDFGWDIGLKNWGTGMMSSFTQEELDSFTRGLFVARFTILALNSGACGVNIKSFYDNYCEYYNNRRLNYGLLEYKDTCFKAKPQYYSYSLIMKNALIGAKIYPLGFTDTLSLLAVNNPDKSFAYFIVNNGKTEETFTIKNKLLKNKSFSKYVYSEESLPKNNLPINKSGEIKARFKTLKDSIKPNTFVVYRSKK